MIVNKTYLARRTFLRGAGTAIAIPMLDAMVPAMTTGTSSKAPVRMAFVYVPNGIVLEDWRPAIAWKRLCFHANSQAARAVSQRDHGAFGT